MRARDLVPNLAEAVPVHPALAVVPEMSDEQYAELRDDIATHGQRVPSVVDRAGRLLDGRARLRACADLGIAPLRADVHDGDDPASFVMAANVMRRVLDAGQRAMIAALLVAELAAEARARQGRRDLAHDAPRGSARDIAAQLTGASNGHVGNALRVLRRDPALAERVRAGDMTLGRALQRVDPEHSTDTWLTPRKLLDDVRGALGIDRFDLDPATTPTNPVGARRFYTFDDGRAPSEQDWNDAASVWLNPPFSGVGPWVDKVVESAQGRAIVLLLPATVIGSRAGSRALRNAREVVALDARLEFRRTDDGPECAAPPSGYLLAAYGTASIVALAPAWGSAFVHAAAETERAA